MCYEVRPYRGKEGVWEYDIRVRLPNGIEIRERKKSPVSGRENTKRWTAERERELYQLALSGELQKQRTIDTVEEFWPKYVGAQKARDQAHGTLRIEASHFKCWIAPNLGRLRLDKVGGEQITAVAAKMADKGLKPGTISGMLAVISGMLQRAKGWGQLKELPQITYPEKGIPVRKVLPPHDFDTILQAARKIGPEATAIILLAGQHALRIGEVMALWWDAIDFDARTLEVKRGLYEGHLGLPKNRKMRRFKVTPETLAALRALPRHRPDFVLVRKNGEPHTKGTITTILEHVYEYADIPYMGPHALRHCAATRMAIARTPAHVIRQITGHRDLTILQTYLQDDLDLTDIAVQRLAELDQGARGEIREKTLPADVIPIRQKGRRGG